MTPTHPTSSRETSTLRSLLLTVTVTSALVGLVFALTKAAVHTLICRGTCGTPTAETIATVGPVLACAGLISLLIPSLIVPVGPRWVQRALGDIGRVAMPVAAMLAGMYASDLTGLSSLGGTRTGPDPAPVLEVITATLALMLGMTVLKLEPEAPPSR